MSKAERIQQALDNTKSNIELMAGWPHKKLIERLELINIQSVIAEEKRDTESLELLEVWRSQLIEARIHKFENNIPDEESEIEKAIADVETVSAQLDERTEILSEENVAPVIESRKKQASSPVEDNQLPLF